METVGEILRREREKQGLTIKDIENATSIRSLYIKAIEDDAFDVAPGEVYLKGFIRNYANHLRLDSAAMLDVYRRQKNGAAAPLPASGDAAAEPAAREEAAAPAATEEKSAPKARPARRPRRRETDERSGGKIKWIVAIVVVLAVLGFVYSRFSGGASETAPKVQTEMARPAAPPAKPPDPPAAPQTKPIVVTVRFSGDCWTAVTADGKTLYERTAKDGESFTWRAGRMLTLSLGNAGAADVTYNGQEMGKFGASGEVKTKTFRAGEAAAQK